jgi:hypothetical protein
MRAKHDPTHSLQSRARGTFGIRLLGRGLALSLALSPALGCDSKDGGKAGGDAKADAKEAGGGGSELAKKASAEVEEIKGRLDKGEDIKYACAGNLAQYADLGKSDDDADKKAYAGLQAVCYVDGPKKVMADLRAKMEKGELGTMDTVNLSTILKDDKFPKDGDAAKVAEEGKKLLEVEVPTFRLNEQIEVAKKEKEEGKSVSMGCIKAKQVVDKSGEALGGDDKGKAALDAYAAACPEKK